MADKPEVTYMGMTLKQAILIGVLGTIFVGVILFGQGNGESADATPDPAATVENTPQDVRRKSASSEPPARATQWPKVSLNETLQHNPFEQPAELREPEPEIVTPVIVEAPPSTPESEAFESKALDEERRRKVTEVLADLQSQKVKMILRGNQKVAAMIGERLVHEGDVIDGVRVISILPNGVLVEPAIGD